MGGHGGCCACVQSGGGSRPVGGRSGGDKGGALQRGDGWRLAIRGHQPSRYGAGNRPMVREWKPRRADERRWRVQAPSTLHSELQRSVVAEERRAERWAGRDGSLLAALACSLSVCSQKQMLRLPPAATLWGAFLLCFSAGGGNRLQTAPRTRRHSRTRMPRGSAWLKVSRQRRSGSGLLLLRPPLLPRAMAVAAVRGEATPRQQQRRQRLRRRWRPTCSCRQRCWRLRWKVGVCAG